MGAFELYLPVPLVTDFNKRFLMQFLEHWRAISMHYIFIFAPLACLMYNLAQGTAQKNPCFPLEQNRYSF